jgi:hypothetical protein
VIVGRGLPGAVLTAGWATIGLLLGHVAAYDVVYPDAHVHADALAASGHGWLVAMGPTLGLSVLAVLAAAVVGVRNGRPRSARFRTLAAIQVGAFVAIEIAERLTAGDTAARLGHELMDHGLWLILVSGILVQLVTAWIGSAVSRGIADATGPVARTTPRPSRRAPALDLAIERVCDRRPLSLRRDRAPPRPVASPRPI